MTSECAVSAAKVLRVLEKEKVRARAVSTADGRVRDASSTDHGWPQLAPEGIEGYQPFTCELPS